MLCAFYQLREQFIALIVLPRVEDRGLSYSKISQDRRLSERYPTPSEFFCLFKEILSDLFADCCYADSEAGCPVGCPNGH